MTLLPQGSFLRQKRYRVDGFLGQGGFGITYRGHDTLFNEPVAIKEYYPKEWVTRSETTVTSLSHHRPSYKHFLEKFINEGRALTRFREVSSIVSIRDVIPDENGTAYLVMELVEGKTLTQTILSRGGMLNQNTAIYYTREIGGALAIMHGTGIIHRDISPDNVIITPDNKITLIDFGSARAYAEHTTQLTSVFKRSYAPPEQMTADPSRHGPPTDIYALGATLYRMLTGKLPASGMERVAATILNQIDPLISPRRTRPDLFPEVEHAILTALQLTPEDRPPTIPAFLGMFPRTAESTTTSSLPSPKKADHETSRSLIPPSVPPFRRVNKPSFLQSGPFSGPLSEPLSGPHSEPLSSPHNSAPNGPHSGPPNGPHNSAPNGPHSGPPNGAPPRKKLGKNPLWTQRFRNIAIVTATAVAATGIVAAVSFLANDEDKAANCAASAPAPIVSGTAGTQRLIAVGVDAAKGDSDAAVWLSDDQGQSWRRAAHDENVLGGPLSQRMGGVLLIGERLVAVGYDYSGSSSGLDAAVWLSDDLGESWRRVQKNQKVLGGDGTQAMYGITKTGNCLIAVGVAGTNGEKNAAVWTSHDQGETWQRQFDVAKAGSSYEMLDVVQSENRLIAVGTQREERDLNGAVWVSDDNGKSWSQIKQDPFVLDGPGVQRLHTVKRLGSTIIALGENWNGERNEAALWRADKLGNIWVRTSPEETVYQGVGLVANSVISTGDRIIAVGARTNQDSHEDAAVWISTDKGKTWERLPDETGVFGGNKSQEMTSVVLVERPIPSP